MKTNEHLIIARFTVKTLDGRSMNQSLSFKTIKEADDWLKFVNTGVSAFKVEDFQLELNV